MLTAFQTVMLRVKQPVLKQKLKHLIELIVSVSLIRSHNQRKQSSLEGSQHAFSLNTDERTRLEPITTNLRSKFPNKQAVHQSSIKDNAKDIPTPYKPSFVLPPLQHIKN
jgi:hypothetical protein